MSAYHRAHLTILPCLSKPSTISSLARSTFSVGRPSSIASTPPAAYAVNVDPDVRRRADSDIKQATSNLLLALAKLIYQDSQGQLVTLKVDASV